MGERADTSAWAGSSCSGQVAQECDVVGGADLGEGHAVVEFVDEAAGADEARRAGVPTTNGATARVPNLAVTVVTALSGQ